MCIRDSSTDELDRFAACLTLTGGGGTDFRPAFAKIEELRRDGTLRDLQGVLYFTDGKGIYPTRRPPYETAFLFLETGTPPPDTPPWAMRLVLSPEEFLPDPVPKTPEIDVYKRQLPLLYPAWDQALHCIR